MKRKYSPPALPPTRKVVLRYEKGCGWEHDATWRQMQNRIIAAQNLGHNVRVVADNSKIEFYVEVPHG